jgi:hypothetical protein
METIDFVKKSHYRLETYKGREKFVRILIKEYIINLQKVVMYDEGISNVVFKDSHGPRLIFNKTDENYRMSKELKFVLCFQLALQSLEYAYAEIINKEYINPVGKDWWKDKYASSTYYRNRTLAINNLVENYQYE